MSHRRDCLKLALASAATWPLGAADPQKKVLSAPLTHSDWMLQPGVAWGPDGIHHMLDACKASGWSHVYWRALDGGRANYRSRLIDPGMTVEEDGFYTPIRPEDVKLTETYTPSMTREARLELARKINRLDYSTLDTLEEAVRYGHRIGLHIHAWISINEDDHGWGTPSRFTKSHLESRWRKRDGTFYRSQQSFAFDDVMRYKLAVVDEILRGYDVDGLFLDWIRTGDVRDNPQTDAEGVADHGYEQPLLDAFRTRYGIDPLTLPNGDERWLRLRAEPHTEFLRRVRALTRSRPRRIPIAAMVAHPWCYRGMRNRIDGNLRGLLLDVTTWAREGLIDSAVAAGYYMAGGTPEMAYQALRKETEGRLDLWLYAWVPRTESEFHRDFTLAESLGVRRILYWEADYIDARPNRDQLQQLMRSHAEQE